MKRKILSFVFAILVIIPCAGMLSACDIFADDEHTCVATETYNYNADQHWFKCEDTTCSEKIEAENHDFDSGVLEGTTKTYTCTICGYEKDEHVCKKVTEYDNMQHWNRCEDATCNLDSFYDGLGRHVCTEEFVAVSNGYNTIFSCECGYSKTIQTITFNDSVDGSVEVIDENVEVIEENVIVDMGDDAISNKQIVFMPKANEGKYFLKWQVEIVGYLDIYKNLNTNNAKTEYSYSQIYSQNANSVRKYTPIFTDNVEEIAYYDTHITGQNDLTVEIYYIPYCAVENPVSSFYIKDNPNLMLQEAYILEKSSSGFVNAFGNGDENIPLPYNSGALRTFGGGGNRSVY